MIELIWIYLRFGFLGFGGPFALIAMMEQELVRKRKWLSLEQYSQAIAIIKVLPGATATQVAIYTAKKRAGSLAAIVCGTAFIFPAALLVLVLSIFYARMTGVSQASSLFQGMQVGALVVIGDSILRLSRPYWKSAQAGVVALVAGVLVFKRPGWEPFVILSFGLYGILQSLRKPPALASVLPPFLAWLWPSASVKQLFLTCLKAGFLVFGTGLAIIPVLEADVVGKYHWLTHPEFLDGIAIGQITPGPVSTTATFIGYKVGGISGAVWATIAVFTSSFFNMLILLPIVERRMNKSPKLKYFTDWAFPAVIGGILATSIRLGISTVTGWQHVLTLVVFVIALLKWKMPAWAIIPLSGFLIFGLSKL